MKIIKKYFPLLTSHQVIQFSQMKLLYKQCNTRINLISQKTIHWFYECHVLHSLCVTKTVKFLQNALIMDAGTGGGFPGIPLAILYPTCNFFLVDSITKKILLVKEIVNTLELKNLTVECSRIEHISNNFDFIITRAIAYFPKLIHLKIFSISLHYIPNAILALKGGYLSNKKKKTNYKWLKYYFKEEVFLKKNIFFIH